MDEDDAVRRVHFYSADDLSTGFYAKRAAELSRAFSVGELLVESIGAIELHHVRQYLEHDLLPGDLPSAERDALIAKASSIRSAVSRYFSSIDEKTFSRELQGLNHDYKADFLLLLGQAGAFKRLDSSIVFQALESAQIRVGMLLGNSDFLQSYDEEVRALLLEDARNGELLVRRYMEKADKNQIRLPKSLSPSDSRDLLERYIDSEDANLNYVRLIANAGDNSLIGLDPKLRLRAKRRAEVLNDQIFKDGQGYKTGVEVRVADNQDDPVLCELDTSDGSVWKYSYSRRWLEETLDGASVLNNFQSLLEFADEQAILNLPSYPANLGVMERVMGVTGNSEYKTGVAFNAVDNSSLLQTLMYERFLEAHETSLEQIISWFFQDYLVEEFGVEHFTFSASSRDATYLERVRHLFAEMESVASQFNLFVENGVLDRDLLTIGSDPVKYREIPSLKRIKYLYAADGPEISGVLHLLFSDQSRLNYVDADLSAENAVSLIVGNHVPYERFQPYQKRAIDFLVGLGLLENTGGRVQIVSFEQILLLKEVFLKEAASYHRLSLSGRAMADQMVSRGWLTTTSTLLTGAEADYFNYFLNRVGFSNGPNLRNRYVHGAQGGGDSEAIHFDSYMKALRLVIALVIKINDDFCLEKDAVPPASH